MKFVIILLIVALDARGQRLKNIAKDMIPETKRIMQILEIPIRDISDSAVFSITVDTSKYDYSGETQILKIWQLKKIFGIVTISPFVDSLVRRKHIHRKEKILGRAVIIHELTHCLQMSQVVKNYIEWPYRAYVLQPVEFEAYAVDSYYVLMNLDPYSLNLIMSSNIPMRRKIKSMINVSKKISKEDKLF